MKKRCFSIIFLVGLPLQGCTSLPNFYGPLALNSHKITDVPKVSDVISHIQCEMISFFRDKGNVAQLGKETQLVAYITLTIEVTDDGNLNPDVAFIHPLQAASTQRSIGVKAQWESAAHRTYTQSFAVVLDPQSPSLNNCTALSSNTERSGGIRGDLGLARIMSQGLNNSRLILPLVSEKAVPDQLASEAIPTFGSTIDFTVTYGGGVDPGWTLTHFTGPGGGSSSLISYTRTSKDTLIVSFAKAATVTGHATQAITKGESPANTAATPELSVSPISHAVAAAMNNTSQMLLINLLRHHGIGQ